MPEGIRCLICLSSGITVIIMIIITVIFIAPYLPNKVKGEHTALCKINNDVYIKTSKIINYIVVV